MGGSEHILRPLQGKTRSLEVAVHPTQQSLCLVRFRLNPGCVGREAGKRSGRISGPSGVRVRTDASGAVKQRSRRIRGDLDLFDSAVGKEEEPLMTRIY